MAAIWFVSAPENQVTGPVTVVCMQTEDDADASLLYQDGAAVLIDTGEETDADHILEVLGTIRSYQTGLSDIVSSGCGPYRRSDEDPEQNTGGKSSPTLLSERE